MARIKVLGVGCAKCKQLEKAAGKALEKLDQKPEVEHIINMRDIASYGVMNTPGLVIDDKVVSTGKVLKVDEIVELIKKSGI